MPFYFGASPSALECLAQRYPIFMQTTMKEMELDTGGRLGGDIIYTMLYKLSYGFVIKVVVVLGLGTVTRAKF
jgi:hypothetical protein